jgi:predicted transcriptional regulator
MVAHKKKGVYVSTGKSWSYLPVREVDRISYKGVKMVVEEVGFDEILEEFEKLKEKEEQEEKAREEAIKKGVVEGFIIKIEQGVYRDFMSEELLKKLEIEPDTEAVRITAVAKDYPITVVETMRKSFHKKAKFRRIVDNYIKGRDYEDGKAKVKLVYDKTSERWKIFIP